jgi:hypothetical protein
MKGHSHRGVITSIGLDHQAPNHLSVTIAHGKKKPVKKGESVPSYDERPRSNILVHKKHASKYSVGQAVNVGMSPSSMDGEGPGEADGDSDGDEQESALGNYRGAVKSIVTGGGAKKRSARGRQY